VAKGKREIAIGAFSQYFFEMLKKVHFVVDGRGVKCCFSSTMNWMTLIKTALRLRGEGKMVGLLAGVALAISSCTSGPGPGMASDSGMPYNGPVPSQGGESFGGLMQRGMVKPKAPASGGTVDAGEAFAQPAKERPGLATAWGRGIKAPLGDLRFTRASVAPVGVDAIFYNNREGLVAMDAMDMKVDAMQVAAGGIIEWGIKGSIGYLPAYKSWTSGGYRRFVQGSHGGTYSIVIKNRCKSRVQVVASVDGLDVLDGKAASVKRPGYVIDPGKTLEIEGFRTSYDAVAAFQFSSVSESYANLRHGDTRNVGVIGIAVYTEKGFDPWTWMPGEVQTRNTANPFATAR
jgi:hypothetical protein